MKDGRRRRTEERKDGSENGRKEGGEGRNEVKCREEAKKGRTEGKKWERQEGRTDGQKR